MAESWARANDAEKEEGVTAVVFCCSGRRRGQRPLRGLLAPHRPLVSAEGKSLTRRPDFGTQMRALHQNLPPFTFQTCGGAACKLLPPETSMQSLNISPPDHQTTITILCPISESARRLDWRPKKLPTLEPYPGTIVVSWISSRM